METGGGCLPSRCKPCTYSDNILCSLNIESPKTYTNNMLILHQLLSKFNATPAKTQGSFLFVNWQFDSNIHVKVQMLIMAKSVLKGTKLGSLHRNECIGMASRQQKQSAEQEQQALQRCWSGSQYPALSATPEEQDGPHLKFACTLKLMPSMHTKRYEKIYYLHNEDSGDSKVKLFSRCNMVCKGWERGLGWGLYYDQEWGQRKGSCVHGLNCPLMPKREH